jgi:predicted 3-demethylubiquinone-9 3-methyltransferase (glyoxalase superfamily)
LLRQYLVDRHPRGGSLAGRARKALERIPAIADCLRSVGPLGLCPMQKITPFLWFDDQAEAAANFYVSVFKNSKVKEMTHYIGEEPVGQKGSVMTVAFELDGQEFVALNGGPRFKFTEAFSFVVNCETQEEIDYYWDKLTAGGGEEVQCGWLTDKYGLSWQVVPMKLAEWARDAAGFQRVMHAVMPMKKLDLAALQKAYDGK